MLKVFGIRDVKADSYEDMLMVVPTQGIAKRAFVDAVAQKGSRLSRYAEDFSLLELGEFNAETGELIGARNPVLVMTAIAAAEVAESERMKQEEVK